jgi:hypothetical protein
VFCAAAENRPKNNSKAVVMLGFIFIFFYQDK